MKLSTVALCLLLASGTAASQDIKTAKEHYRNGMYQKAATEFEALSIDGSTPEIQGWRALSLASGNIRGYEIVCDEFIRKCPYSGLVPQIRFQIALNRFEERDYEAAVEQFNLIPEGVLDADRREECRFKKAYSLFETGDTQTSAQILTAIANLNSPDYSAPSQYLLGYIAYRDKDFVKAGEWFTKSSADERFAKMSLYYVLECRFMNRDYSYVTENGPLMMEKLPSDCKSRVSRMISESYLIKGNASRAEKFFGDYVSDRTNMDRMDYFLAGSMYYALGNYEKAVENYSQMPDRTDSIGQLANYQLAYSYIETKNKAAALDAFRKASVPGYSASIREDAYFNYAKLAFDLNNDPSVFTEYLKKFPSAGKNDRVYGYMAVAALMDRDYASAVDAFNHIDYLEGEMKGNYMKANYLRAVELVGASSYAQAVPCLKAATYYSDSRSRLNQLSRFWLAESLFHTGQYEAAREQYTKLYNISALNGSKEYDLIPFGMAYCYFREENYRMAVKWLDEYLSGTDQTYRKGALLRKADCLFMQRDYSLAASAYDAVIDQYSDTDDLYACFQSGICYGLLNRNDRKSEVLSPALNASPSAAYFSDAVYELGRSYVASGNASQARHCFIKVIENGRDSNYVARSLLEMGLLAKNAKDYDNALIYYKKVVDQQPSSEYADDALAAIESVYQIKNEPYEYLAYIETIGRSSQKTESEKEAMVFNAAEQTCLAENYEKALKMLEDYSKNYPGGQYTVNCNYYIAECLKNLGRKEQACRMYSKVVDAPAGSFTEAATLSFARLSFDLQQYDDAYGAYSHLLENALIDANKLTALQGMMRSAYRGGRYQDAVDATLLLEKDKRSGTSMILEAKYLRAKSLMGLSRRDEAMELFGKLSLSPSTEEGAEAAYIVIQDSYDRGAFAKTEELTIALMDSGTSIQYWVAKACVVLGDSYLERDDLAQAKATWESIQSNYKPSNGRGEDVLESVSERLAKLQ